MASTYSTNLALELIGSGDQSGTWGLTTNNNLGTLLEQAVSGYVTQAVTDGADTVLTIPNGLTGVARNAYIELTGALTAARNVTVPANRKSYHVFNNTTGGFSVTFKVSGQTGVVIPNGKRVTLYSNGTDIVEAYNHTIGAHSALSYTGPLTGAVTGNASTATALQTARAINGVNFDGTAPITVTAAAGTLTGATLNATVTGSSLTSVGTITGGTWSASFGAVSGANLTSLTAANIAAGTAGINISGNAATATSATSATNSTNATNTAITDDTTTAATMYPTWVTAAAGNLPQKVTSTKLTFNPSTGAFSSTSFVGGLTGNASTATALQTARAINGVNFDGTAAITVTAAAGTLTGATLNATVTGSSLTSVGTISSGTWSASFGAVSGANLTSLTAANISAGTAGINISGNAATATSATSATTATNQSGGTCTATAYRDDAGNLLISSTNPSITSGFNGNATIIANNTAAFQITIGNSVSSTGGVVAMPAAPNGWVCSVQYLSGFGSTYITLQTGTTTTSITVTNYAPGGNTPLAFVNGATLLFQCTAF